MPRASWNSTGDPVRHDGYSYDELCPMVEALLRGGLSVLVRGHPGVGKSSLAKELAGRPLSDVSFVVREGARLAARSGKEKLDQASLLAALRASPAREREGGEAKRRIGFV